MRGTLPEWLSVEIPGSPLVQDATGMGSFDSAERFASEPFCFAQDDKVTSWLTAVTKLQYGDNYRLTRTCTAVPSGRLPSSSSILPPRTTPLNSCSDEDAGLGALKEVRPDPLSMA
jgi:hypothetical protein